MSGRQDYAKRAGGGGEPATRDLDDSDSFDAMLRDAAHIPSLTPECKHTRLHAGTVLAGGRMHVRRCIGEGGMGLVYEAFDADRRALVALKTLSNLDPTGIYRLKHEFRALAEVSHPNLVGLHELFSDDAMWFFTMDLVEGERFDRWVRPEAGLDESRLRQALSQVVQAVRCIHRAGQLHRDLKPSNILVGPDGRVTVLDFGLATSSLQGPGQSTDRGLIGTPEFMAPEQASGLGATAASDLYAIGVMLFEALTGRLPFEGRLGAILGAKQVAHAPDVFGLCPSAPTDLAALCMGLLRRDPCERPDGEAVERLVVLASPPAVALRSSHPPALPARMLFGRATELEALRRAYRQMCDGSPVVMFVAGESGIGKSALVEAFLNELKQEGDGVVLQGRCFERELVPFKAFDSLVDDLSRYLVRIGVQAGQLMPREVFALARLFPVLGRVHAIAEWPRKEVPDAQALRALAFVALSELMGRLRDRHPLVLFIDDLQWLDADSTLLLKQVLGAPEPVPLLLLASYRDGARDANALLAEVLKTAQHNPILRTRELALLPLSQDATRSMAEQLLGDGSCELASQVAAEAQGSPFFVLQLAYQAQSATAVRLTLDGCLKHRIDQLAPDSRRLLRVLAVAGRPLVDAVAVQAAATDHSALDHLRSERLVRRAGGTSRPSVECYHDRIREAVTGALGPSVLREVHSDVMGALLHQQPLADIEQLVFHCEGAGDQINARRYAEQAGDAAHAALAFDRAAKLYATALRCSQQPESELPLEVKLASVLSDGGRGAEAAPLFDAAAEKLPAAHAIELRRRAAEQWLVSGRTQRGLEAYRKVLGAVGLRLLITPRLALIELLRLRFMLWLRGLRYDERPEAEIPRATLLRIDACKTAWSLSFVNTIAAAAFQTRHLLYALRSGEPTRIALGLGMEAVYSSLGGGASRPRVRALQQAARTLVARLDDPHAQAFTHLTDGQCNYLSGCWAQTCESLEQAERILAERCRDVTYELNSTRFFWGNALVFRGRWSELGKLLDAWLGNAELRGDLYATSTLSLLRARSVTLARGDASASEAEIDWALSVWKFEGFGVQQFLAFISRLQVYLYQGRTSDACTQVEETWPLFSRSLMSRIQVCRIPAQQHAAYSALAMAASSTDNRRWLKRARSHARRLRAERVDWATAFALQIEASIAHLSGQPMRCREGLQAAAALLEQVNMHFYAAAIRWRLGELIGGEPGASLIARSDALYREQGVAAPARLVSMMTPGLAGSS